MEEINVGEDTLLSTPSSAVYVSTIVLTDTKVLLICGCKQSRYAYGIVCKIEGSIITKGKVIQISNNYSYGYAITGVKLFNNKVCIMHSCGENKEIYIVVCTIDEDNITVENSMYSSTELGKVHHISIIALSENKICAFYSNYNYLRGMICTIEEGTIKIKTRTNLGLSNYIGGNVSAIALKENKIFVAYSQSYSINGYLYGMVCSISDTSIIARNSNSIKQ